MVKIAFGHKCRSGKDTSVQCILSILGDKNCEVVRFASPVYDISEIIQNYLHIEPRKDPKLLQLIGTGLRSVYNQDIWIDLAVKKIEKTISNGIDNILVPDMRFINEARELKKLGFITVRIDKTDRAIDRDPMHISEIELDNYEYDYMIENNGTISELNQKILKLMEVIVESSQK